MIVFLHGVPETAALWDKVRAHLDAPSVALSLPGFACARPQGFGATKDEYLAWLVGELADMDEPIDLVGHDWGAPLVFRVAATGAVPLRSWVTDGLSFVLPEYEWHDFAKIWQTPEAGEAFWAEQLATPLEERASLFEAFGLSHEDALTLVSWVDPTMASCIPDLYRSAMPNVHADWPEPLLPTAAPGMVLVAPDDPFGDEAATRRGAAMVQADVRVLDGVGHWWALQKPAEAAAILTEFFDSVG